MKNIVCVNKLQECIKCKLRGFFCYTPEGGVHHTCPCCGTYDFMSYGINDEKHSKYDRSIEDNADMRNSYYYCNLCKIIFDRGCEHAREGCTDGVYNCHFIERWKDKTTGIEYDGMPQFDDTDDWYNNVNNIEVLQMHCAHNGALCEKTLYKIDGACELMH